MRTAPSTDRASDRRGSRITRVALFLLAYLAVLQLAGFATNFGAGGSLWHDTLYGLLGSLGAIALTLVVLRWERAGSDLLRVRVSSLARLGLGILIGLAAFALHLSVVMSFAGPIRIEPVDGLGASAVVLGVLGFMALSSLEELGFRGYALQRLHSSLGLWPALGITTLAFAGFHLLYGWELRNIVLGVLPAGLSFGMSAVASRGLALPIGLHAAWNIGDWLLGQKSTPGPWRVVVDPQALESLAVVAPTSYLATFGLLTLAFWLVHRRRQRATAKLPLVVSAG